MAKDFTSNFANLDRDIERYAERYCHTGEIMGTPAVFGYDQAVDTVFDTYLEAEAYGPVIDYLPTEHSYEWGLNEKFLRVSELLHRKRHIGRLQAPAIAHEWRSGKALKPAQRPISTVKGESWEDRDLPGRFPEHVRHITAVKAQ